MSASRSEKGENFMRKFRNRTNSDFSHITASELIAIWDHYDLDGNGFLENEELDLFLREFVSSACSSDVGTEVVSETMLGEMKQDLLDAYDDNEDGRIELSEKYTMDDVEQFRNVLLQSCDLDGDGKICKEELTVILLGLQKFQR
uniref:EF-hand domain-containing protein n=1 Tax=Plectus sambesii TaxID=2011161 RepID=A0A914X5Y7_9BILA